MQTAIDFKLLIGRPQHGGEGEAKGESDGPFPFRHSGED
jgi:hypothetical protein